MATNDINVFQYLDLALRRKWLILIPLFLCSAGATYLSVTLPPIYESETTILVEPPQVPEEYVQSTVTGSVQDRLNTISQQILSRTRLESVIREMNLYPRQRQDASMEYVVQKMRRNINIQVEGRASGREGSAVAFQLSYSGEDPSTVQKVTQKLAMLYIEENLREREKLARETKEFLESQLARIQEDLLAREKALRDFREAHMGELPEQLEANLRTLDQLQQQRGALHLSLQNAQDRLLLMEQQLAGLPRYLEGGISDEQNLYAQLEEKRRAVAELQAKYTDRYPDVLRLKAEIKTLERRLQGSGGSFRGPGSTVTNPSYTALDRQIQETRLTIRRMNGDLAKISRKMKTVETRVESAPSREQELMVLTRDYQTIKASYDSMMERKLNSEIAENLERRQKSEQFRILDQANYPHKPVRPNRLRILLVGLALGVGIGGGLAYGTEYIDRSIRTVEVVKESFSIPVVGVIPQLWTDKEMERKKKRRLTLALSSVVLLVVAVVLVHLLVLPINELFVRLYHSVLGLLA